MNHYLEDFLDHNYERFVSTIRQLSIKKRKSIVDKSFEQSTCLSIACENRDYEMIDFLLVNCKADTNILCLFNLKNRTTCTPLMFACAKNLTLMVKLLIEYGNADVNQIDSNGENCLFYAVRGGEQCQDLVEYLIDKNVDFKKLNNQGHSVLNYSLNHQSSKMTLLLLDLNCPMVNTVSLDSPLLICALNGDVEKYNMLYCEKDIPKELKILGSEILGAVLCENRELVEYSVFYWQISLQERGNIEKTKLHQMDEFLPEFANENDFNRIDKDTIDLCMQSLWIRERILLEFKTPSKLSSINIYQSLHTTCAEINTEFANPHSYLIMNQHRLETLWLYSLGIQLKFTQSSDDTLVPNLIDYVLYLTYANTNMKSTFQLVNAFKVAKMCLYQIGRLYPSLRLLNGLKFDDLFELNDSELASIDIDSKTDGCENGELYFILKVFILALRLLTMNENYSQLNDMSRQELNTLTKRFIYIDMKLNNRYSLLDVSLKHYNITWFGNHDRYVEIKCPVTQESVSYLLECGADPNSCQIYSEKGRNTCFNKSLFRLDDQQLCERLILVFLKYGAHFDYSNDKILAPVENFKLKYGRSIPVDVVNPVKHTSLKCLCTKVIRREQLEYCTQLPKELVEFVNLH